MPSTAPVTAHATIAAPSEWVRRWAHLVPMGNANSAQSDAVLDVACGTGRHLRFFHERGHQVTGLDRDAAALATVRATLPGATLVEADIEHGPWPLPGLRYAGVVVTNYLWRALLSTMVDSVAPGGVLIYETFAQGNEHHGKPSNPNFLLRPGELLTVCAAGVAPLRVIAYEDVTLDNPARCVQRVAAVRD